MADNTERLGYFVGVVAAIAAVVGGWYFFLGPGASMTRVKHLQMAGSSTSTTIPYQGQTTIAWVVSGMTPNAIIDLGTYDGTNPSDGSFAIGPGGATGYQITADGNGNGTGSYTFTPSSYPQTIYFIAYDNGTPFNQNGYSNTVTITFTGTTP